MYKVTLVVFPEIALLWELVEYGSIAGIGDFCGSFSGMGLILLLGVVSGVGLLAVLLVSQLLITVQDTTRNNDKIACL
jgi:TM2 domain-containing membrane protein YozV